MLVCSVPFCPPGTSLWVINKSLSLKESGPLGRGTKARTGEWGQELEEGWQTEGCPRVLVRLWEEQSFGPR